MVCEATILARSLGIVERLFPLFHTSISRWRFKTWECKFYRIDSHFCLTKYLVPIPRNFFRLYRVPLVRTFDISRGSLEKNQQIIPLILYRGTDVKKFFFRGERKKSYPQWEVMAKNWNLEPALNLGPARLP